MSCPQPSQSIATAVWQGGHQLLQMAQTPGSFLWPPGHHTKHEPDMMVQRGGKIKIFNMQAGGNIVVTPLHCHMLQVGQL